MYSSIEQDMGWRWLSLVFTTEHDIASHVKAYGDLVEGKHS